MANPTPHFLFEDSLGITEGINGFDVSRPYPDINAVYRSIKIFEPLVVTEKDWTLVGSATLDNSTSASAVASSSMSTVNWDVRLHEAWIKSTEPKTDNPSKKIHDFPPNVTGHPDNKDKPSGRYLQDYIKCRNEISKLTELKPNWDSYGSPMIKSSCIIEAFAFITSWYSMLQKMDVSAPKPFVAPTSDGGIQLEWDVDDRYFEVSFSNSDSSPYFYAEYVDELKPPYFEGPAHQIEYSIIINWLISEVVSDQIILIDLNDN